MLTVKVCLFSQYVYFSIFNSEKDKNETVSVLSYTQHYIQFTEVFFYNQLL